MASTAATRRKTGEDAHAASTPAHAGWSHTPHPLTLGWLAIALPVVVWDMGYVLLRPHSMPGGRLHWVWAPYALYGAVDYNYGFKQWESGNGFTAAQSALNLVENLLYAAYVGLWWRERARSKGRDGRLAGRTGAVAVLIAFSAFVMTVSKTLLYFFNEAFSGWENIRHNTTRDVIVLYLIPNGLWLVFPAIITCILFCDIASGLERASLPLETKKSL